MNTKRIELLLLLSFLILFSFFIFTDVRDNQQPINIKKTNNIEQGFYIGHKTTIKYLYIDGYLPDTLIIDTTLFNDIKKYYFKK